MMLETRSSSVSSGIAGVWSDGTVGFCCGFDVFTHKKLVDVGLQDVIL